MRVKPITLSNDCKDSDLIEVAIKVHPGGVVLTRPDEFENNLAKEFAQNRAAFLSHPEKTALDPKMQTPLFYLNIKTLTDDKRAWIPELNKKILSKNSGARLWDKILFSMDELLTNSLKHAPKSKNATLTVFQDVKSFLIVYHDDAGCLDVQKQLKHISKCFQKDINTILNKAKNDHHDGATLGLFMMYQKADRFIFGCDQDRTTDIALSFHTHYVPVGNNAVKALYIASDYGNDSQEDSLHESA